MLNTVEPAHSSHAPALEARDLRVDRSGTQILRGLSCTLPRGSITGLLGPSGCGKTTFMRSIVGVQCLTGGTLTVLGQPAGSPSLRRRVAYTSQSLSIYADISVRENVTYFARLVGASRQDVDLALERVQLGDLATRRITELSGGQANRASLACALVGKPDMLVLDEPTVGLDPLTRLKLWQVLRSLAADGTTLLISSHVMDEAQQCDSVLFMREGRFLAHDSLAAIEKQTGTTTAESAFLALIEESA